MREKFLGKKKKKNILGVSLEREIYEDIEFLNILFENFVYIDLIFVYYMSIG